jgi:hypothetical protein
MTAGVMRSARWSAGDRALTYKIQWPNARPTSQRIFTNLRELHNTSSIPLFFRDFRDFFSTSAFCKLQFSYRAKNSKDFSQNQPLTRLGVKTQMLPAKEARGFCALQNPLSNAGFGTA